MIKIAIIFFMIAFTCTAWSITRDEIVKKMHWFGQGAIRIEIEDKNLYIDPFQLSSKIPADIILITHPHNDHFSLDDIAKVINKNTIVFAPEECSEQINSSFSTKIKTAVPGMKTKVQGIMIEAVPAYNIVKTKFHPKTKKWVGYIISAGGIKIYHTGDTERIPEMKKIKTDIVLLPLGQTYTMGNVDEAISAALDVKAKIAIPIHYGQFEGKAEDADYFKKQLSGKIKVILLENKKAK